MHVTTDVCTASSNKVRLGGLRGVRNHDNEHISCQSYHIGFLRLCQDAHKAAVQALPSHARPFCSATEVQAVTKQDPGCMVML